MESHDHFFDTNASGQPRLRFSSWTINRGTGPLELRGGATHPDGTQDVYQRTYNSDGSYTERLAGIFAVVGGRLRFTDSADYFLKEVTANDGVGGIVAGNEKIAYCLVDTQQVSNPPPGTPANQVYGGAYPACGQIMGISVGWYDLYSYTITNQWIILTGVSSGTYWLENKADPLNRMLESDETNNSHFIKIAVTTSFAPEIDLLGNGQSIPNNDTTPSAADHTDFGYVDVASGMLTRTFTIQNTGTGSLSLTGVPKVEIIGSADFIVSQQPSSPVVANGGAVTFQVTFDPSALGAKTATVWIVNNDGNEAPYQFAIGGNADVDGDGLPDGWEALYNVSDPNADDDGDGFSNRDEFLAGTNPRSATSLLKIKAIIRAQSGCQIVFDSLSGRQYRVEYKNDLAQNWTLLEATSGTGSAIIVNDPGAVAEPKRFYRLTTGFF